MLMRVLGTLAMLLSAPAAYAAQPEPWAIGFQPPANALAEQANNFHNLLLVIIFVIAAFVLGLLGYTIWRFAASRNPVPSRTTHNTTIEVVWTVVPILILVIIAIPSMRLLYAYADTKGAELTVKAVGHQWYWSYEYPDNGNYTFDAYMVPEDLLEKGQIRLLSTDNPMVIPVDTKIRMLITSSDVLHAWAVPAFFNKIDAVGGRANELLIAPVKKTGTYFGQCSELCGVNHTFMPIEVKVVSKAEFSAWAQDAAKKFPKVGAVAPKPSQVDVAGAALARPAIKE